MAIGMILPRSWQWRALKRATTYELVFESGVCMSHHFATTCMELHNHRKEGKHVCCKKNKKLH
jgi:hypothetical protein